MKKILLIMGLLLTVTIVNSYNYPSKSRGKRIYAYEYKTLEVMYDSKKRPHKIVIYTAINSGYNRISIAAIDLDANTYK